MTIQQLKYVLALDNERHFSKAAEACDVSQPGLTIQLKKLEEEIGIQIFDRSSVPMKPTILGLEIIKKAKRVLKEVNEIRDFVIHEKNVLEGITKLGVVSTLCPYLIPLFMKKLKETTPKMEFIISEDSTEGLMDSLETGEIDIALMSTPTGNKNLQEYPIFNEPFIAYLNLEHGSLNEEFYEINEKDKQELLLLKEEFCYNAQLLNICDLTEPQTPIEQISLDISSIETLKNLVRSNLGFAIMPKLAVLHEENSPHIKTFKSPQPIREISLVVSTSLLKSYYSRN